MDRTPQAGRSGKQRRNGEEREGVLKNDGRRNERSGGRRTDGWEAPDGNELAGK